MKEFDTIRLLVLSAPFGVFITYVFILTITFTLEVKHVSRKLRPIITLYCALVVLTGALLPWFYYDTEIFEQYNIIYFLGVVYMTIAYYNLVYFTTDSAKKFMFYHYLPPAITGFGLYALKFGSPDLWSDHGNEIVFLVALVFVVVYTSLQFVVMYRFGMAVSAKSGTPASINKGRALPFISITLVIPIYLIVFPLFFGPDPSLFVSIIGMLLIILTNLAINLPIGYSIIQHYGNKQYDEVSLFEPSSFDKLNTYCKEESQKKSEIVVELLETPKNPTITTLRKSSQIDRNVFEQYFRLKKPYLDSKLTILDLVEPLQSNRSYISKFFKEVYGMNFTSYINHCRLNEVERLRSLSSNKNATLSQLVLKAGFGDYSSYYRARKQLDQTIK